MHGYDNLQKVFVAEYNGCLPNVGITKELEDVANKKCYAPISYQNSFPACGLEITYPGYLRLSLEEEICKGVSMDSSTSVTDHIAAQTFLLHFK